MYTASSATTVTGDITAFQASMDCSQQLRCLLQNNNASGQVAFIARTLSSGGDPYFNWNISGVQDYALGIDHSDNDILKCTTSSTPSAGDNVWNVHSDGSLTLFSTGKQVTGGLTVNEQAYINSPALTNATILTVAAAASTGSITAVHCGVDASAALQFVCQNNNATTGQAKFISRVLNTGDPSFVAEINGGQAYCFGLDNSDSDKLKIRAGGHPSTGDRILTYNPSNKRIALGDLEVPNATVHILQGSTTGATAVLELDQDDTDEEFIEFDGNATTGAATSISTSTTSGSVQGHIQITVNGTKRWLAFYDDPS
jgi:hypothetical protein